jgi:two-component system, chemotaxis family, chemotaxis protein CheY
MSEMVKTAEKMLDHILIIDDDKIYQLLCKQIIRNANVTHHVDSCLSAEEGIDLLKSGKELPQLIFLDINMPGMNGWDFLDAFKKLDNSIRRKVKIVMLSSSVFAADKIKAGTYREVTDYVVKPLTIQRAQEIVQKYF